MTENLLTELEVPLSVRQSSANIQDLVRIVTREVGSYVHGLQGSAKAFSNLWRNLVLAVAGGAADQVQKVRAGFVDSLAERIHLANEGVEWVKETRSLLEKDPTHASQYKDWMAILDAELTGLKLLESSVCAGWQTIEDLEDLAARDFPLTAADLDKIGQLRPPDATWYQEGSKPF